MFPQQCSISCQLSNMQQSALPAAAAVRLHATMLWWGWLFSEPFATDEVAGQSCILKCLLELSTLLLLKPMDDGVLHAENQNLSCLLSTRSEIQMGLCCRQACARGLPHADWHGEIVYP